MIIVDFKYFSWSSKIHFLEKIQSFPLLRVVFALSSWGCLIAFLFLSIFLIFSTNYLRCYYAEFLIKKLFDNSPRGFSFFFRQITITDSLNVGLYLNIKNHNTYYNITYYNILIMSLIYQVYGKKLLEKY